MTNLDEYRKILNLKQTELRTLLTKSQNHTSAIDAALVQHARLHSAKMAEPDTDSYADLILDDLTDTQWRTVPHKSEHSIAWIIWHITRIEDVTMNILVVGVQQVLHIQDWAT